MIVLIRFFVVFQTLDYIVDAVQFRQPLGLGHHLLVLECVFHLDLFFLDFAKFVFEVENSVTEFDLLGLVHRDLNRSCIGFLLIEVQPNFVDDELLLEVVEESR